MRIFDERERFFHKYIFDQSTIHYDDFFLVKEIVEDRDKSHHFSYENHWNEHSKIVIQSRNECIRLTDDGV